MADFELEESPEITIADNPAGKLILVITVVLAAIGLFYFVTECARPAPDSPQPKSEAVTSENQ